MTRKALGRGLKALIPEADAAQGSVRSIPLDQVDRNTEQPRRYFDEEQLNELKESIETHGVLEPIIVRPVEGRYEVVVGERRWRAAQLAGLTTIPAVVRPLADRDAMEIALVENLQREDLNPVEEAEAYRRLMTEFEMTQEEVAERVGKKRSTIANRLRLLELDDELVVEIEAGRLSAGHAKVLLGVSSKGKRLQLARRLIEEGWSVRALEEAVRIIQEGEQREKATRTKRASRDPLLDDVEERLKHSLGTKVRVVHKGGRGKIEIEYYNEEDRERLFELLTGADR